MGRITQSHCHCAVNAGILSASSLITHWEGGALVSLQMKELRLRGETSWQDNLVWMWQIWDLKFGWSTPKPLLFTLCFFRIKALLTLVSLGWMLAHIIGEYYFCKDTGLMGHQQEHSLIVLELVNIDSVWRTLGFWFKLLAVCPESSND